MNGIIIRYSIIPVVSGTIIWCVDVSVVVSDKLTANSVEAEIIMIKTFKTIKLFYSPPPVVGPDDNSNGFTAVATEKLLALPALLLAGRDDTRMRGTLFAETYFFQSPELKLSFWYF